MQKENGCTKGFEGKKTRTSFPRVVIGNLHRLVRAIRRRSPIKTLGDDNYLKAFTLIELLVVVLIIGILAAIALPQYQKAVWKSRFIQAKTIANSIAQAEEIFYLANGKYTKDINELSIDVPATSCSTNGTCYFSWGECVLLAASYSMVQCYTHKNGKQFIQYEQWLDNSPYARVKMCVAYSENLSDISNQICKAETGRSQPSTPQTGRLLWDY